MQIAGIISSNIAAQQTITEMNQNQAILEKEAAQLSTGSKVSEPQDNPASYAIAQRLATQVHGYAQGLANASQGISMVQTAIGGIEQQTSILQQLHVLAVQAANDSNSQGDRATLQNTAQQLINQLQTIATQTQFNGKQLLNGENIGKYFQVGANQDQTISVGLGNSQIQSIGNYVTTRSGEIYNSSGSFNKDGFYPGGAFSFSPVGVGNFSSGVGSNGLYIQGKNGSSLVNIASDQESSADIAKSVNAVSSMTGVTAMSHTSVAFYVGSGSYNFYISTGSGNHLKNAAHVMANVSSADRNSVQNLSDLVSSINSQSDITGVTAQVHVENGHSLLILNSTAGHNINISAGVPVTNHSVSPSSIIVSGYVIASGTVISSGNGVEGASFTGVIVDHHGLAVTGFYQLPAGYTLPSSGTVIKNITENVSQNTQLTNAYVLPSGSTVLKAQVIDSGGEPIPNTNYNYGGSFSGLVQTKNGQVYSGTFYLPVGHTLPAVGAELERGFSLPQETTLSTQTGSFVGPALASGSTGSLSAVGSNGSIIPGGYPLTSGTSNVCFQGAVQFASSASYSIKNGSKLGFKETATGLQNSRVSDLNLGTSWGAQKAMVITEQAINILNQMGADLGAVQKRLQSSVTNDQSAFVANSAAQSTVTSANVALATTKFTQAQIIQKSGISTMNIEQSIIKAYLKLLP